MTKLLDQAFGTTRSLSDSAQDQLARLIMQITTDSAPEIQVTAEEDFDLAESDKDIDRGDFATDERMRSIWAKNTL